MPKLEHPLTRGVYESQDDGLVMDQGIGPRHGRCGRCPPEPLALYYLQYVLDKMGSHFCSHYRSNKFSNNGS